MPSERSYGFIDGGDDFLALTDDEHTERSLALSAVQWARTLGISVEAAAAQVGTDIDDVEYWASEALQPKIGRRTQPTPTDDLYRVRPIALEGEVGFVGVSGSRRAKEAERIFGIQWDYANGHADVDDLARLSKQFRGRRVVRDPNELDVLARRGVFDIEEIYNALIGS